MASDVDQISALKTLVEDATYSDYGPAEEHAIGLQEFCSPAYVRRLRERATVLVAVTGDATIVGMVARRSIDHAVELSALYCSMPGQGIGTALLLAAIEGIKSPIEIEVYEGNTSARRFFEHLGFGGTVSQRPSESYAGQTLIRLTAPAELVRSRATATATA